MNRFACLVLSSILLISCTMAARQNAPFPTAVRAPVDAASLRLEVQAIVDAFTGEVARVRGGQLASTPAVEVRTTPQLISFVRNSNQIVIPDWETASMEMKPVFRTFAGGGDTEAEQFFRAFFNRFLVAHEAAHWFQAHADRRESTLYANEDAANRLAVAFWRTQPGGERFLSELEGRADRAASNLADPTPAGQDPVTYFGANYQALAREPLKYGYYQFRFMRDAIRARSELHFDRLVR